MELTSAPADSAGTRRAAVARPRAFDDRERRGHATRLSRSRVSGCATTIALVQYVQRRCPCGPGASPEGERRRPTRRIGRLVARQWFLPSRSVVLVVEAGPHCPDRRGRLHQSVVRRFPLDQVSRVGGARTSGRIRRQAADLPRRGPRCPGCVSARRVQRRKLGVAEGTI